MKYGIAVTTIFDGKFVDDYYQHFQKYGGLDQVAFYIIDDLATPEKSRILPSPGPAMVLFRPEGTGGFPQAFF